MKNITTSSSSVQLSQSSTHSSGLPASLSFANEPAVCYPPLHYVNSKLSRAEDLWAWLRNAQRNRSSNQQRSHSISTKDRLATQLTKDALGSLVLKVTGTGLGILAALVLARLLDAHGYGTFTYAMAWINLLVVPATLGLDILLTRQLAAYATESAWGLMHGLLRRTHQAVLATSLALGGIAGVVLWTMADGMDKPLLATMSLALLLLPLMALNRLRQSAMQGLNHIVTGQIPDMLIQPVVFLGLLGVSYLAWGAHVTAPRVMGLSIVVFAVTFFIGARMLARAIPASVKEAHPTYQTALWYRAALPLLFLGGLHMVNTHTDILMLGAIRGVEEAGIYSIAARGAELIIFGLIAVNTALAPKIASLHTAKDLNGLQRLITTSTRTTLFLSLPIAISFIFYGDWFLGLFGSHFMQGATALSILCAGQLINAGMGSVGLLLLMTGYEQDAAKGFGLSACINVVLNALLIPLWDINGAAIATAVSLIVWNVVLAMWVYERLSIHTTALGNLIWR